MPKITLILLILPLLCCSKEKEPPSKQVAWRTQLKQKQAQQVQEECDSLCEFNKKNEKIFLRKEEYIKKIKTMYEDSLKKIAPKCKECDECEIEERIDKNVLCVQNLKLALRLGVPYLTIGEKIEEDEKIKFVFKERFGVQISDFALSIVGVFYYLSIGSYSYLSTGSYSYGGFEFSAVRTATGASGNTLRNSRISEYDEDIADIDMDTWLDFIWALQKFEINKWERIYFEDNDNRYDPYNSHEGWTIIIYYLDREGYIEEFKSVGTNRDHKISKNYPPNFAKFTEALNKIKFKTKAGMLIKGHERKKMESE